MRIWLFTIFLTFFASGFLQARTFALPVAQQQSELVSEKSRIKFLYDELRACYLIVKILTRNNF